MVGDKLLDPETGRNAGALGSWCAPATAAGRSSRSPQDGARRTRSSTIVPAAAEWILASGEAGEF
jgi:hypothetical protein